MFFLGVDGGGTKTAFAIINREGELLAHTEQGTSYIDQVGIAEVERVLKEGTQDVCGSIGIKPEDLAFSFWGLPGFGENLDYIPHLERMVNSTLGTDRFKCGNDVEVGWAGSLACRPGIHLVAGTGAIGYGVDQAGNSARSSGWSEVFGDEGSAYWIGNKALGVFSKQADQRLPRTPLYSLVKDKLGLERDLDLIPWASGQGRNQIATLSTTVFEAAQLGDTFAIELFREAAYEHALTVEAIIAQLDFFKDSPIQVSYSGGVFKSGELVLTPLREFLEKENVLLQEPILLPITGACLYALVQSGETVTEILIENLIRTEQALSL